ncbi:MAG: hypothetical protein A2521_05230 [Deltaproteobacteria bacterium RIFOXYD12_FULL_57_12]|nr:MAG: hypothetical protein A2521_05230 [Deltaproteobacteria bacterium RIFOXYD12_FULL_57_12]
MSVRTGWKLIVVGFFLVGTAGLAQARMGGMMGMEDSDSGMGPGMGMMHGGPMEHGMMSGMLDDRHPLWGHLDGLDLDEKQRATIRERRNTVAKEVIRKKADLQIGYLELADLLHEEQVDLKAVEKKLKEVESMKTALLFAGIKATEEIKALLTPAQRKKLKEMRSVAHDMPGKRDGMRRDMKGGPAPAKDEAPAPAACE